MKHTYRVSKATGSRQGVLSPAFSVVSASCIFLRHVRTFGRMWVVAALSFLASLFADAQTTNSCVIPDPTVTTAVACGCYYWEGSNFTQSGTYSTTVITPSGQDSVLQLVLTVMVPDSSSSTVNTCGSYTWNGMTYTSSGRYYYHLSRAAVGCDSVAVLDLNLFSPPASPAVQALQPTCFNPTGSLQVVSPLGEGFQYSLDGVHFQFSTNFSSLQPGTYQVYTLNQLGCISASTTVTVDPVPAAPAVPSVNIVQAACYGMTASVSVLSPLRPDYQYSIDGGPYQVSRLFSGLSAGTHTVSVIDSNGCTSSVLAIVAQPSAITVAVAAGTIACFGGSTTVSVAAQGGTSPYVGTGVFTAVVGTHSYTVTDANGCTSARSVTISQPAILASAASATPISCFGSRSSVTVTATGGTAPYSGTGVYSVPAGSYSYTVVDSRGCSSTTAVTLTQPAAITVMATASTISCNGGLATVTIGAVGGTSPYSGTGTFTVPAGTYSYTVTDAAGCSAARAVVVNQPSALNAYANSAGISCNGQRATVTVSATGGTTPYTGTGTYSVPGGPYTYTVTDANGCTAGVGIIITEPPALSAAATVVAPLVCNGSTATVSVVAAGGTAPYTGNGTFAQSAGTTTYTVIDNNGCTATSSVTLTQPPAVTATVVVTNATCTMPGSATASPSGGSAPYQFLWSNGATTATSSGLAPGGYSVTITDNNGCTNVFSCTIRLNAVYPGLAGSITGQTTVRVSAAFTYSILPVSGATSYRWTLPANCTGASTTTSITVTFLTGFASGSICVTPLNACGDGGTSCKAVMVPTIAGTGSGGKVKDKIPTGLGVVIADDSTAVTENGSSGIAIQNGDSVSDPGVRNAADLYPATATEDIRNLVAYPNPSRGKIVIGFNGIKGEQYVMQLFDMSGNLIASLTVTGQEEMNQILYDTSILASGTYSLSVTRANGSQRRSIKLVVQ